MRGGDRPLAWLRSQGCNVALGLVIVALLAVGSFVMAATRTGASAGIEMDAMGPFFRRPALAHLWFYLLIPAFSLWAASTFLCTWDTVLSRWRAGSRSFGAYGAALVHVSFGLALLAHLVGGLGSRELGEIQVGSEWTDLPDGRQVRLVDLDLDVLPGGMPRSARCSLQARSPGAQPEAVEVDYNRPLMGGLGSTLYLLSDVGTMGVSLKVASDAGTCDFTLGGTPSTPPCGLEGWTLKPVQVLAPGIMGPTPWVRVRVRGPTGREEDAWLAAPLGSPEAEALSPRKIKSAAGLGGLTVESFESRPQVTLRGRVAPGNPIAVLSVLLLGVGLLPVVWRRARPLE